MDSTPFVSIHLSEPSRTVLVNVAQVIQVDVRDGYDRVRADLANGEALCGTRGEMSALLNAVGYNPTPAAPTPTATQVLEAATDDLDNSGAFDTLCAGFQAANEAACEELLAEVAAMREEAEAVAELRARWELFGNRPTPVARERHAAERLRPSEYRRAQRDLFGAARDAGMSTDRVLRVAGAVAFFADTRITSWTQLSIAEMSSLRAAIERRYFNRDWTLRVATVPGLPVAVAAFFGGVRHAA